jgi:hypothetical protein
LGRLNLYGFPPRTAAPVSARAPLESEQYMITLQNSVMLLLVVTIRLPPFPLTSPIVVGGQRGDRGSGNPSPSGPLVV